MRKLNLEILNQGLGGISKGMAVYYLECLKVALAKNGHKSGVILKLEGFFKETFVLDWQEISSETVVLWHNQSELAEKAAVAVVLLLMQSLTEYQFFEQSELGSGIDYWMSKKYESDKLISIREARLEISGILEANTSNSVNMRVNLKRKQSKKSDKSNLPAWIAVVDFGIPKAKIEKK